MDNDNQQKKEEKKEKPLNEYVAHCQTGFCEKLVVLSSFTDCDTG